MDARTLPQLANFLEALSHDEGLEARYATEDGDAEVQRMTAALNAFLDKLWLKDFQLSAKQEMLEKVVEIRTKEVHEILDNVSSGFLIALPDETILDNFSRSCIRIFGREDLKGKRLTELLGLNEREAGHFACCYEQVFDSVMPIELTLGQLPTEFKLGESNYRMTGSPILGPGDVVTKVFFTITDTTELKKAEAENALRQALLEILRQKDSFREFLYETSRAFEATRRRPTEHGMRSLLHTTKGNLGIYGLHELAALIHAIEDSPKLSLGDVQKVEDVLKQFLKAHEALIGIEYPEASRAVRSVDLERLLPFLDELETLKSEEARRAATSLFVRRLQWVPAGALLTPLKGLAQRVAERLGKEVDLVLRGQEILVDPDRLGPVLGSLGHLVRNAIDHGIEPPRQRGDKPKRGRLQISVEEVPGAWRVRIEDDGRGLDGEGLVKAALARGVITTANVEGWGPEEKIELLFLDQVSTKEEASMESGRGIGAGAVRDAVMAAGGRIRVESELGRFTRFSIEVPNDR